MRPLNRRHLLGRGMATAAVACGWRAPAVAGPRPAHYPPDYEQTVEAARREGRLVILGSTDALSAQPLVNAFMAEFPGIAVTYSDLNTRELDRRYRDESAGAAQTDVVWSSAMDTQIALVMDRLAQPYASVERAHVPDWAEWRRQAYAATYEPVVFGFNRQLLPEAAELRSHADLAELLQRQRTRLAGRVAMLHPGRSALALMLEAQDAMADAGHDRLLGALGAVRVATPATNNDMLKGLASGEFALGYNMLGSYLDVYVRRQPQVAYVVPNDYALVVSRVMLIAARAPHPAAARLWIDFALSAAGQTVMATACGLGAVRSDVDGPFTLRRLRDVPGLKLRPIGVSAALLSHLDPARRAAITARWERAVGLAS